MQFYHYFDLGMPGKCVWIRVVIVFLELIVRMHFCEKYYAIWLCNCTVKLKTHFSSPTYIMMQFLLLNMQFFTWVYYCILNLFVYSFKIYHVCPCDWIFPKLRWISGDKRKDDKVSDRETNGKRVKHLKDGLTFKA